MATLPDETTRSAQQEEQMSDEDARGRRETRAMPEEAWARSEVAVQAQDELAATGQTLRAFGEYDDDQKPETD